MNKVLEFSHISKEFPGVKALNNVSFKAEGGKVTALMGENGAGKSTLLKILSGDLTPDTGCVVINGEEKHFANPNQSIKSSISVIYQERQLVSTLSVMENIFLEALPVNKLGLVNKAELKRRTQEILDAFGLPIKPDDIVGRLSIAYQQMVEIMKAYRRDSDIIAFDEPTAPLTDKEIDILFELIKKLRDQGKVVLYVSHRMAEIFRICDDIVVLKDGQLVNTFAAADTNENELVKSMVGRDIGDTYASLNRNDKIGDVLLEVQDMCTEAVHDISFTLHKGEILGFAGLVGAGRTEVARGIFGADAVLSGKVIYDGEEVHFRSPKDAIDRGIALCPEDRKEEGLMLRQSSTTNVTSPILSKVRKGLFMDTKTEDALADTAIEHYRIKTPSHDKLAGELSGGNQQKIILGRWTSEKMPTRLLILDEPTKGIDVGAKAEIYQTICDYAKQGIGVIFISSELTEVINISDHIIVMHNGHITGKLAREEASEERVLALAMQD